jgi:hypothetical protein
MRLGQRAEKTVLLSIGKRNNKVKMLPVFQKLASLKYKIYATYKTHKFLRKQGIEATLVNKISNPYLKPNLLDLLEENRFDLIINIPTGKKVSEKEKTDGQIIREYALKNRAYLITDVEVAKKFVEKLEKISH